MRLALFPLLARKTHGDIHLVKNLTKDSRIIQANNTPVSDAVPERFDPHYFIGAGFQSLSSNSVVDVP